LRSGACGLWVGASETVWVTGVMSAAMPSPSMNGMIGLSGTGCPGTIRSPAAGTLIAIALNANGSDYPQSMRGTDAADQIAALLVSGFDENYRRFRQISALAKERFEAADWAAVGQAVRDRIQLEDEQVDRTAEELRTAFQSAPLDAAAWRRGKLHFVELLVDHKQPELAEPFFNSVSTRALGRTYVRNELMFLRAALSTEYIPADPPTYRSYYPHGDFVSTSAGTLGDFRWNRPFAALERDCERLVHTLEPKLQATRPSLHLCVLSSAFYRNKAAYVVGKVVNGNQEQPFAIAVVHDD